MPPFRRSVRKKTSDLINAYGFSTDSIQGMRLIIPYLPLSKIVEAFAKYLLAAESREEQRWHVNGEDIPLIQDYFDQKVALCKPKAQSYNLPGGRYSPDYLYILEDGTRVVVEVKGSKFQKGYRDAVAKMKAAATLHWYDKFMLVMWANGHWELTEILPDKDFITELHKLAQAVDTHITEQAGQ